MRTDLAIGAARRCRGDERRGDCLPQMEENSPRGHCLWRSSQNSTQLDGYAISGGATCWFAGSSVSEAAIQTMKAFEVRAERAKLPLVSLQAFAVLFDVQRVAPGLMPDAFRNQSGNLPIQALPLHSESLSLMFLVNVHAPLRG